VGKCSGPKPWGRSIRCLIPSTLRRVSCVPAQAVGKPSQIREECASPRDRVRESTESGVLSSTPERMATLRSFRSGKENIVPRC